MAAASQLRLHYSLPYEAKATVEYDVCKFRVHFTSTERSETVLILSCQQCL